MNYSQIKIQVDAAGKNIPKNKKLFLEINCDPEGIRTPNRQSRNLIFYPVELLGHYT